MIAGIWQMTVEDFVKDIQSHYIYIGNYRVIKEGKADRNQDKRSV